MQEWIRLRSSYKLSSAYKDEIRSDIDISCVIKDQSTIYSEVVEWIGINIQDDAPVTIHSNVISTLRHSIIGPLAGITPFPDKILSDKSARGRRTSIQANYSIDLCILILSSVFTTYADSQHFITSTIIVMIIVSVSACIEVWN